MIEPRRASRVLVLSLALAAIGCAANGGGPPGSNDAGPADAGAPPQDAGEPDAGSTRDGGPTPGGDAGPLPIDGGAADAGRDAGPVTLDAGPPDAGAADAGGADAGCDPTRPGSPCAPVPDPPVIDGEPSAGHDSPSWTWSAPTGAVTYRYRLDGGAWVETTDRRFGATGLADGSHTIEVVACNAGGGCSTPARFTTVIEELGPGYPGVWAGVERPNLTTTAIGHVAPVSCHNCYNGPSNEILDTAAALAKIGNALRREADLIELDINDASGTLCVNHGDPASCAGSPTLEAILSDAAVRAADAMLFVEIKETGAAPAAFATALLGMLDAHREVVRNGRPLFVRAFASRRDYLLAIQSAASGYPMIAPYLRYAVLYGQTTTPVATLQGQIASDVAGPGFDMVELHYQQSNMAGLVSYAHSLGLGVGVWTIPGSFGEVFLAALREDVDELTVEYRVDQARRVVEEVNTYAYVNSDGCGSASDPTVEIARNFTGARRVDTFAVNRGATSTRTGTPALHYDSVGEDRFGCSLDFRSSAGMTQRAVDLGAHRPPPGAGYLITAVVNFDTLAGLSGTQAIVNASEAGGYALELTGTGSVTTLRFGVHVGGSYRYHGYDVSSTGLASNRSLNGTDSYLLTGAYDGDGGVYLFVNNERSGSGGTFVGDVTDSGQPGLIGADPQPGETIGARFFFDGLIQRVSVLAWGDHRFTGSVVND